jgi:hypothetical protein
MSCPGSSRCKPSRQQSRVARVRSYLRSTCGTLGKAALVRSAASKPGVGAWGFQPNLTFYVLIIINN